MLLGGGTLDGKAALLLYQSTDLTSWKYQGLIDVCVDGLDMGYMYECPSYIQVDGKDVLFLSLMGREPEGDRYHNEFSSLYFIGNLNLDVLVFPVPAFACELCIGKHLHHPDNNAYVQGFFSVLRVHQ